MVDNSLQFQRPTGEMAKSVTDQRSPQLDSKADVQSSGSAHRSAEVHVQLIAVDISIESNHGIHFRTTISSANWMKTSLKTTVKDCTSAVQLHPSLQPSLSFLLYFDYQYMLTIAIQYRQSSSSPSTTRSRRTSTAICPRSWVRSFRRTFRQGI